MRIHSSIHPFSVPSPATYIPTAPLPPHAVQKLKERIYLPRKQTPDQAKQKKWNNAESSFGFHFCKERACVRLFETERLPVLGNVECPLEF